VTLNPTQNNCLSGQSITCSPADWQIRREHYHWEDTERLSTLGRYGKIIITGKITFNAIRAGVGVGSPDNNNIIMIVIVIIIIIIIIISGFICSESRISRRGLIQCHRRRLNWVGKIMLIAIVG